MHKISRFVWYGEIILGAIILVARATELFKDINSKQITPASPTPLPDAS